MNIVDEVTTNIECIKNTLADTRAEFECMARGLNGGKRITGKKAVDEALARLKIVESNVEDAVDNIYSIVENAYAEKTSDGKDAFAKAIAENTNFAPNRMPTSMAAWIDLDELLREWYANHKFE